MPFRSMSLVSRNASGDFVLKATFEVKEGSARGLWVKAGAEKPACSG